MGELLLTTGNYLLSTAINRMLSGAGLTLATAGVSMTLMNSLIDHFKEHLHQIPNVILALVDIAGIDIAISLSVSAIISRMTIKQAQVFLIAKEEE